MAGPEARRRGCRAPESLVRTECESKMLGHCAPAPPAPTTPLRSGTSDGPSVPCRNAIRRFQKPIGR
eukprot:1516255-Pyramimonas_sp.AAC.1